MKILLVIFVLTLNLLSCTDKDSQTNKKYKKEGIKSISNFYDYDTLTLFARYNECGEWGGHTEIFELYLKEQHEVWVDYKKDSVNCEDRNIRNLTLKRTFKLPQKHQLLIIQYLHDLLDQNFIDKGLQSHAGNYYSVISSDSSLVVSHYADYYEGFDQMRNEILGDFR